MYRCPECGSEDVSVRQAEYMQVDGAMVLQDVDTYDTIYSIWCNECDERPEDDEVGYDYLRCWEV